MVDDLDGLVVLKVTGETDGDVVGAIIGIVELTDVTDTGVLEVFLGAEHGVLAVRYGGIEGLVDGQKHFPYIHGGIHVKLLVYGLEFGVETTDHEVLEPIGLYDGPASQFGVGNDLMVAGVGRTGIGIDAGSTDTGHELVELIGNGDLGAFVGERVDQMIDRFALLGIGGSAINLIERVDGKEVR